MKIDREICKAVRCVMGCSKHTVCDVEGYRGMEELISRRISEAEKRKDEECEKKCAQSALDAVLEYQNVLLSFGKIKCVYSNGKWDIFIEGEAISAFLSDLRKKAGAR